MLRILSPVPLALLWLVGLPGCTIGPPSTATISYSQLGACNGYSSGSGATAARPNVAYVIFKIDSIDNTRSSVDLEFVPVRLYVDQSKVKPMFVPAQSLDRSYAADDPRFTGGLGLLGSSQKVIPAGHKDDVNGYAVVEVMTSTENGAAEAHATSYALSYDADMGEVTFFDAPREIVLVKSNAGEATWPQIEDCRGLDLVS